MRLSVDLGTPLPKPPREGRCYTAELAEELEWSNKVARKVIMHSHTLADKR